MEKDPNDLLDEYTEQQFFDETYAYIRKETDKDIEDMVRELIMFGKLYHKHMFDDDQRICEGYAKIMAGLKEQIKELSGKTKQHKARS